MNKDIQWWAKMCIKCQRSKFHKHTVTPLLLTFATSDARFNMVQIDIVDPLSPSNGFRYIPTCIDRFTQWPEAISSTEIMAETVPRAFVSSWIACFAVLSTISTDRGRQFDSCLWKELMRLLGSKRMHATALPSKLEWPGRTIPPTTQGCTQGSHGPVALV